MKTHHPLLATVVFMFTVSPAPAQSPDGGSDPVADSFKQYGRNGNGVMDLEEAPIKMLFNQVDTNNDSKVDLKEYRAFMSTRGARRDAGDPSKPPVTFASSDLTAEMRARFDLAAEYAAQNNGFSLLIMIGGQTLFEQYTQGFTPDKAYRLASGTKSFWGPLALVAEKDGLLSLDETVADTITEWRDDPRKSRITVRQLLTFTSGLFPDNATLRGPGAADKFKHAISVPTRSDPGEKFAYGAAHLFAFGEFLSRKLSAARKDPDVLSYLHEKILDPIGLEVDTWTRDAAGNPQMPFGAYLTARQWAKFGQLILNNGKHGDQQLIPADTLPQVFKGTEANPRYGLNWWLIGPNDGQDGYRMPADTVSANGAGNQRLIVIPSLKMVVVRQGETTKFSTAGLLSRLLDGKAHLPAKRD
ncbi:MAG: serine hydrolase [Planctomycetota bacterium]|jgi:CubicO group peptidase (beta-lactamase class C family)